MEQDRLSVGDGPSGYTRLAEWCRCPRIVEEEND